jgi:hypothetical protein
MCFCCLCVYLFSPSPFYSVSLWVLEPFRITLCRSLIFKWYFVCVHDFRDWCCHLYSSCSSAMQRYVVVLAYIGSQCTNFNTAGLLCWFFMSFLFGVTYPAWYDFCQLIRSRSMSPSARSFVRWPPMMQSSCPGYHWLRELNLRLWPWDKATILPMENKIKVKSMLVIFFDVLQQLHENLWRPLHELWRQ